MFLKLFICLSTFHFIDVHSAESNGQKAHFQVEDKSGDLKVIATKDMAKVTSQADSVQVVVKPGMADYPVVKSDKPIVHVTNDGWNSVSIKKSLIVKRKQKRKMKMKRKKHNSKNTVNHPKEDVHGLAVHKKARKILALFLNGNLEQENIYQEKSSSPKNKAKKSKQLKISTEKEQSASKKSSLQSNEVGFEVKGTAGKLNMNVTRNGTQINSESGMVDVFLKRKPSSEPSSDSVVNKHNVVHIAPDLANSFALRKSHISPRNKRNED